MSAVRAARHSHVNGDGYFCRGYDPKAEWGCDALKQAMQVQFAVFESRYCLGRGDGMIALMDFKLPRDPRALGNG